MNARFAMGFRPSCRSWMACAAGLLVLPACSRPRNTPPDESSFACQAPAPRKSESFASEMRQAMRRLHDAMDVAHTDDSDRDFAEMMIPHHQGAVDMALAELRFGRHEQLRRLAAGIVVEQRSEIALMERTLQEIRDSYVAPSADNGERSERQRGIAK